MLRHCTLAFVLVTTALSANLAAGAPPKAIRAPGPVLQAANLERSFTFRGLFFSLQANDLAVVSARNPGALLSVYKSGATLRRIDASGAFVFAANEQAGLRVLDYTDPRRPRLARLLPPTAGYAAKFVKVLGHRAFLTEVAASGAGPWNLRIYDVSTPAAPVLKQSLPLGAGGGSGAIVPIGPAHVAVAVGGAVKVVYVGYPRASIRATLATASPAGMVSKGKRLYLSRGCGRFGCGYFFVEIWDLSTPARPVRLRQHRVTGWYTYSENSLSIAQLGQRTVLFMSLTDGGEQEVLGLLDVTSAFQPRSLSYVRLRHPSGWWLIPADVDVVGNTAFVWGWRPPHFPPGYEYFTTRIDVSAPTRPKVGPMIQIPPR